MHAHMMYMHTITYMPLHRTHPYPKTLTPDHTLPVLHLPLPPTSGGDQLIKILKP